MGTRTARRLAWLGAAVAVLALAILAAGCGSSNNNSNTSANSGGGGAYGGGGSSTQTASSTGAATISTANNAKLGTTILVDSKGMTVYYFEKDKKGGTTSSCSGACATVWPPVTTSGSPKGTNGASASKLGTIKGSSGTQVTYNGWPLYTYTGDSKPGDANGNNLDQFGAEWYALTPAGVKPPGS
jgi:predicted lipoprotein with Yx(FWY)xxD motif